MGEDYMNFDAPPTPSTGAMEPEGVNGRVGERADKHCVLDAQAYLLARGYVIPEIVIQGAMDAYLDRANKSGLTVK